MLPTPASFSSDRIRLPTSDMANPISHNAVITLHYAAPAAMAVTFAVITTIRSCFLAKRRKTIQSTSIRWITLGLVTAAGLSHVAATILYIAHALIRNGWFAPQHTLVFALGSILLWSVLFLCTLAADGIVHWNHTGTWFIACLLEIAICTTSLRSNPPRGAWDKADLSIQVLRIAILATLIFSKAVYDLRAPETDEEPDAVESGKAKKSPGTTSEETQPLLASASSSSEESDATKQPDENGEYGTATKTSKSDSDSDSDDEDYWSKVKAEREKARAEQIKRMEEAGGWYGYVKNFAVFVPYLWPSKDRKMQFYISLVIAMILLQRMFHVLIPNQLGIVVDRLTEVHGTGQLPWKEMGTYFLLSFLGNDGTLSTIQDVLTFRLSQWSWKRLDTMAFGHVMGLSMEFHDSKDSGEVIKAVEQANSLNRLVQLVLFDTAPIALDLIIALGYVTHLFDIYFAFILAFTAIPFALVTYFGAKFNATYRRDNTEKSRMLSKIQFQSISNWPLVSYFNRSGYESKRLKESIEETSATSVALNDAMHVVWVAQEIVLFFAELGIMLLAAYRVSQGDKPVGNFVSLHAFWGTITYPIWALAYLSRDLTNQLVDAERMLQLLQQKPKIVDKEDAQDIKVTKGHVEFKDVNFFYDARRATITNISFDAEGGKTIALVGETGSGKSTLLKLLFRFYDVSSGSITIDGQDIRDVRLESLREVIGNVPQSGSLFNDTILENVRYARLDATEEEVRDACIAACVHEKIMSFADKYHTKVGERGVKLSGGELQRISIARVILKNPQIVLLDEATSAVDSTTEAHIQDAFRKLTRGRTTFVIAHRLSTIMDADMILVVDKGEIVERGTHDGLLGKGGKYKQLWETQTNKQKEKVEKVGQLLDI